MPASLKVLLTVHQFFPRHIHGTERYTLDLAKALQVLGHQVVVLTRNQHQEDCDDQDWNEYVFDGVRVIAVDLVTHSKFDFESSYLRADLDGIYGEILAREQPDIIHCCHLLHLGTNFLSVAACANVPIVMTLTDFFGICWTNRLQTCHGTVCRGPDRDELNCVQDVLRTVDTPFRQHARDLLYKYSVRTRVGVNLLRWLISNNHLHSPTIEVPLKGISERRTCIASHYRHVSKFIAATSYLRNSYIRAGYPENKLKLLHFGIEQPTAEESIALRRRYEDLQTTSRPMIVGFIGQIAKHKGVLDLIDAYERASLENTLLHIYGDLTQDPAFSRVVQTKADSNPQIQLLGTFPGKCIYQKLGTIDVLAVPSTWAENSPLVLLNALASRTMVVVSDVEGMADLVQEGRNGHLVPAGSPPVLAKILHTLSDRRRLLLDWFDRNTEAYSTSPLTYARSIDCLYRDELKASSGRKPSYQRENFPSRKIPPITITCTRLAAPPIFSHRTLPTWSQLFRHDVSLTSTPDSIVLSPQSIVAHLVLSDNVTVEIGAETSFFVKWPRSGLSVIYYGTETHPEFCEAQKIIKRVSSDSWFHFSIRVNETKPRVTRLRWDPLYDAIHEEIRIAGPAGSIDSGGDPTQHLQCRYSAR